ncbi:hypothetical protein [Microbacterium sp. A93]|uniref:hypothetical protein n=1 Tax=Microbacterium sp. A93 TaxID=3450716 RepID=UPI003F439A7C
MTSPIRTAHDGTTDDQDLPSAGVASTWDNMSGVRESRGERRRRRRAERRAKVGQSRETWIATTMEADLPDSARRWVPDWASTGRGRVLLAVGAVIALLLWTVVFIVIVIF